MHDVGFQNIIDPVVINYIYDVIIISLITNETFVVVILI